MCTRWIAGLSLQTGPNSPFPTAKFFLRSFAKGGEKGDGRKNKGTLLRSSKGTTPSPPSAESWRQYRSGMCPWNIRSWLLWRSGSLSPLADGDKSVQLGELEDGSRWKIGVSPCWLWLSLSPGVSVSLSCERRAQRQGPPTRCSSCPGADGKGAAARGRPGRGAARNVLRPHLHFLTSARAMPWFVLSDCSGDAEKGEWQRQNRYRAPVRVQMLSLALSKAPQSGTVSHCHTVTCVSHR